jgi:hypothetical protein
MSILPIYMYFIAINFLASLTVYFPFSKSYSYLRLFPPFLLVTIVIESYASYLSSIQKPNLWIYNFFTVLEFCFYLWVINLIISNVKIKSVIKVTLSVYTVIAVANVVNITFIQKVPKFHSVTYALGCLIIVAFCIYYFFELFRLPKSVKLKYNPAFWICSGLLFFYCCGFPLFGLTNFLSGISPLIIKNFHSIIIILNIFLYSLFTIAFLCRIKIRKYTLSP